MAPFVDSYLHFFTVRVSSVVHKITRTFKITICISVDVTNMTKQLSLFLLCLLFVSFVSALFAFHTLQCTKECALIPQM